MIDMRKTLILLAFAAGGPALAQTTVLTTDCGAQSNQMAMNDCAAKAAKSADAELNAVWEKAVAAVKGGPAAAPLRSAQRAWISYRDLACKAEVATYEGGSIAPMVASQCQERLTRARTADLELFLPN
jgi:uncharacterized protein YecT (DUF1311 family)